MAKNEYLRKSVQVEKNVEQQLFGGAQCQCFYAQRQLVSQHREWLIAPVLYSGTITDQIFCIYFKVMWDYTNGDCDGLTLRMVISWAGEYPALLLL